MGAKIIGASEQSYSVQGQQDTPVFGQKYSMDDTEWRVLCTGLNRLGRIAKEEYGISLTFHHHMGTVVQNPDEVKRLMENTEPEYVSLLFDTGHFAYRGADPLEMAKTYMHRIRHVHLKDIRPEIVQEVRKKKRSFLDGVRMGHLPYRETELLILNRYFRFWNVPDMKVYGSRGGTGSC